MVDALQNDPSLTAGEKVLYRAMFTTMFFGFLRISEAIKGGAGKCDNPPLQLKHVSFLVHGRTKECMVVLTLPPTKTDPTAKEKEYKLALPKLEEKDKDICPYRALMDLVKLRGKHANKEEDLFILPEQEIRSKYKTFVSLMRSLLKRKGYEESEYYTHSFRIGAATSASMLGMSKEEIKTMGRWSSECWNVYIRPDLGIKAVMTAKLNLLTKRIIV
jgi:hypothetical protein